MGVGQSHHTAHHQRLRGYGQIVVDWLPQAVGQGVAGSNPVSPTGRIPSDLLKRERRLGS